MKRVAGFYYFPTDTQARTARLSLLASGCYRRLQDHMWVSAVDQCSLPDDDSLLAAILHLTQDEWRPLRAEILFSADPLFILSKKAHLVCPLLRQKVADGRKFLRSQSEKGKRSGQVRANRGSTGVQPESNNGLTEPQPPSPTLPSSSPPLPNGEKKEKEHAFSHFADVQGKNGSNGHYDNHVRAYWFECLLAVYPRKKGLHEARQLWFAMTDLDKTLATRVIAGAKRYADSRDWKSHGVAPNLDVWLAKQRWDDEPALAPMEARRWL